MDKKENKMTVVEAAKQYQELTNEAAKKKVIEDCGVKTYLPIRDKISSISSVVYNKIGQENDEGLVYYSGIDSMIYLVLAIIEEYTDLQVIDELEDFDALMSSGLMDAILSEIGDDADVYQQMFDLSVQEFLSENNTISKYIEICVNAVMKPIMDFSDAITGFINENGGMDNLLRQIQDLQQGLSGESK